ncbi:MAG: hypothetical protein ACTSXQ_01155 [Alphaproteobacteria bacterium]
MDHILGVCVDKQCSCYKLLRGFYLTSKKRKEMKNLLLIVGAVFIGLLVIGLFMEDEPKRITQEPIKQVKEQTKRIEPSEPSRANKILKYPAEGEKKSVKNQNGQDCWYRTGKDYDKNYFINGHFAENETLVFENMTCYEDNTQNKEKLNKILQPIYGAGLNFEVRMNKLKKAPKQLKGLCLQEKDSPELGLAIDYITDNGYLLGILITPLMGSGCN